MRDFQSVDPAPLSAAMLGDLGRKATGAEARERVLELLRKVERPVLIGEAALVIGPLWTLEETEALLEGLVTEGLAERVVDALVRYAAKVPV